MASDLVMKIKRRGSRVAEAAGLLDKPPELGSFGIPAGDVAAMRDNPPTAAHRAFFADSAHKVHKWAHYLDIYDRYIGRYRDTAMTLLEIGVFDGGSLDMWREYLGADATIVGVDINPACAERVSPPNHVRIGSQDDPAFLDTVVGEFGAPDVILDDGSHMAAHQKASFKILFPRLKVGGLYMIEDAHTSYWREWDGGYRRAGTAIEEAKTLVDDLHGWYHDKPGAFDARSSIGAVHFHDSIIVIEKVARSRPGMMSN